MINAIQHNIICETLTIWAAEFAAGFPTVHEVIYDILAGLVNEYENMMHCIAECENADESTDNCEEIDAELVELVPAIGLSGSIIPVANVRSHALNTTEIFRCRIPHWGISDYLGLHRGCTVTLRKLLGKNPEVSSCVETGRTLTLDSAPTYNRWSPPDNHSLDLFVRPERCPFCQGTLVERQSEQTDILHELVCTNTECKAHLGDKVVHFVSVGGMGIPGMTTAIVEQLLIANKLNAIEDIYTLTIADFMDACHNSYTDAYVLVKSIDRSKIKPMHMLLDAMQIPGITREMTPIIAACLASAGGMKKMVDPDISKVAKTVTKFTMKASAVGIKDKSIKSVIDFCMSNTKMLSKFVELGVAQNAVKVIEAEIQKNKTSKPKRKRGRSVRRRKPRKE